VPASRLHWHRVLSSLISGWCRTIQIWYEDKKLIDHTFTTYWPDESELRQLGSLSPAANNLTASVTEPLNIDRESVNEFGDKVNSSSPVAAKSRWLN